MTQELLDRIHHVRFAPVRLREAPSHSVEFPPTRSVIEEQHRLLSRLFRRA